MRFDDTTFLVTGASRGIGRAVALGLGRRGATVAVHHHTTSPAPVIAEIEAAGGRAFAIHADLGDPTGPEALVERVRERTPTVDGLVANAGAVTAGGIDEIAAADIDRAFALNTRAPLLLIQAALPLLGPGARIVTVSASLPRYANPGLLVQSAAKAALQDVARNLAVALGPRGITVVDVAPGTTRTDLAAGLLAQPGAEEALAAETALGRVAEPEDVAEAIVALLAPETAIITAQSIDLSGGYRA